MTSRSFYVDALILGKHHHHHHEQQQQQHEHIARRNDDMVLRQSIPALSHAALSLYPFITSSGPSSLPEVRRAVESGTMRLRAPVPACLASAAGLPTCLCPFCLPLISTTDMPTRQCQQTTIESLLDTDALTASATVERREWQPWLQQTRSTDTQLPQSTPTKTQRALADRLHSQQLTGRGLCVAVACMVAK